MADFSSPFFVEIHSSYGHAFLPGSYKDASSAIASARNFQQKETDPTTSYLVSDRNQAIAWEASHLCPLSICS